MRTRSEMFKSIREDYPNLIPDHINMVLDLYETDSGRDFIEQICKEEKKKHKGKLPKVKAQLTIQEFEELHKKQAGEPVPQNPSYLGDMGMNPNEDIEDKLTHEEVMKLIENQEFKDELANIITEN